ncbi:MAG: sensor histidine kinase [Clostridium sp.]|nr:sensor histidine kinase [Clostridium sp.]
MFVKVKQYFFNQSIGKKLIICFFSIILILTAAITLFGNLAYKKSINISQNENTNQIITQVNNNVDFSVKNAENIINYMSKDPRVIRFFHDNKFKNDDLQDSVYDCIYSYTSVNSEIAGVMIVNRSGGYISDVMNKISRDSLLNERWYMKACEKPDEINIDINTVGRNVNNIFQYSADEVFSISKAVVDKKTNEIIGVILIDIKLDIIRQIIENVKPGTAGFIYIMSGDDIVYTPVNDVVFRIKNSWIQEIDNNIITKKIKGENYQLTKVTSEYTSWRTIGVFPEKESLSVIKRIEIQSVIIGILGLVIAQILATLFTRSIVKSIKKLRRLMKKAEDGDLLVQFNAKYNDEVGELGNSFNRMVKEINNLMILVKQEEKKKRIAEMNVLQAQIKPHFMYNTLDTIRWMAEENDEEDIVDIIEAFTTLLRISLSKGKEIITIKEEIQHVSSYLMIQKVRYEEKLDYEIKVDDNIMDYKVVKLILQPLVENAIYHGIKEKRGNGKIIIEGTKRKDNLYFSVSDNGRGMDKETLDKINKMLMSRKNEGSGYGIFNVNERIKLMCGEAYGLKYSSVYGEGTKVEVIYPTVK